MRHGATIIRSWPLTWELAKTSFKLRYAGSVLGYLWAILQPLLLFVILLFVFSLVWRGTIPHYPLHLLTGIVVWTYFAEGTRVGLTAFVSHAHLLKNVRLPRPALVLAAIVNVTLTFGINLMILAAFFIAAGVIPSLPAIAYFFLLAVAVAGLVTGISFAIAPLHVLFRDLGQIWEVVLMLGFYGAPIIYSLDLIPPAWRWALWANPVGYIIHFQREALLFNRFAAAEQLLLLFGIVAAALILGWWIYTSLTHRMVDSL